MKKSLIFYSSGGLQMVIALTPVDIFQRNLFYYEIHISCSSDNESLGLVGLLWELFLFFCLPCECWDSMGIETSVGTRVAILGTFLRGCLCCASVWVCVVLWCLVDWVAKVLKQTFVVMIKSFIGTGGVIISLFWTRTLVCLH